MLATTGQRMTRINIKYAGSEGGATVPRSISLLGKKRPTTVGLFLWPFPLHGKHGSHSPASTASKLGTGISFSTALFFLSCLSSPTIHTEGGQSEWDGKAS